MKHDEFIDQVQNRARLASRGDAEVATRAVLETLAERLAGNEPAHAAAQLPPGLATYLEHDFAGTGIPYSLDEFLEIVSRRAEIDLPQATYQARAVMEVLGEAVSAGELGDVRSQLPPEFAPLFADSQGSMSITS